MANRLEPINLVDFTGGLNLRRNQFQLNANESPEMINMTVDPLGGIYTRLGWERWNGPDIVPEGAAWDPRRAFLMQLSDGTDIVYIAANHKVYWAQAPIGATFADLGINVQAVPHMADFVAFGDDCYIACGRFQQMQRRRMLTAPFALTAAGVGSWNNDYSNALHQVAPKAELIEAHSGYLFAANTVEDGVTCPNRLRWSHPTSPDDWAQLDYIDIETGGGEITALQSFEDHLLIFKGDSIWALYGYDLESWQLVQKSSTIGAISPQSVTRNEQAVFFYSASDRGGIYAYAGERPLEISEQLRYALEGLIAPELIWVGWLARKLWVTLPWTYDGPTDDNSAVFVYDPSVSQTGAWMYFTSISGSLGPLVGGSNTDSMLRPLGVMRATETPCLVRLEARNEASDQVWQIAVLGFTNAEESPPDSEGYIITGAGEEIVLSGQQGTEPFDTVYRTPWITNDWPTRKKSFRRPDFICRMTGFDHELQVRSYRDYEELNAKRQHKLTVPAGRVFNSSGPPGQVAAVWGTFNWNDGTLWNNPGANPIDPALGAKSGAAIRRGSSFGLCKALQLRVEGLTPGARWGVDAVVVKVVMRRFR